MVAPSFPWLYHQGIVRRDNLLSSLLVRRFLRVVKDHGVALILLRLVHWASLSLLHMSRDNLFDSISFVSVPIDDVAKIRLALEPTIVSSLMNLSGQRVTLIQPCSMIEVV